MAAKESGQDNGGESSQPGAKPGLLNRTWTKLGLDVGTLMIMFKGACSPIVALALYQWRPFAEHFPSLGFLVAIVATLGMPIMPRAKYIQTLIFNLIAICIGAAMALLICYTSVRARINTTPPVPSQPTPAGGEPAVTYNSSASAVCGVWLLFNITVANSLRFARPQLQVTGILYSIFTIVACTYAPRFMVMNQAIGFVEMLLEAFLSGFAISTVVHFVVFPMNSRFVLMKQFGGYTASLKASFVSLKTYLQTMESKDMLHTGVEHKGKKMSKADVAAEDLKAQLIALTDIHGKVYADLPFAKREVAFGKLCPEDLSPMFDRFRHVFLPAMGLGSVVDIFARISRARHWQQIQSSEELAGVPADGFSGESSEEDRLEEQEGWNEIMRTLHEPFESLCDAILEGLDHASYVLEITKPPKKSMGKGKAKDDNMIDVESEAVKRPGDHRFGEHLEARLREFEETRKIALRTFCQQKGVNMDDPESLPTGPNDPILEDEGSGKNRQQLYLILYLEHLLKSSAKAVLELVKFADQKVEDGTMSKTKLIMPGWRRVKKWIRNSCDIQESNDDSQPDSAEGNINSIDFGAAFHQRKDPEHLPPTNAFQKAGNGIRKVFHFMGSHEMAFGFRAGCATMSLAIIGFLSNTQTFYLQQRLFWATIMTAISMTMTSGSGVFGFMGRILGTALAMILSLGVWYISGGRGVSGAVLPLLFIVIFCEMYILVKQPRFLIIGLVTIITQILILGYELQVNAIGVVAAESNGQAYYPVYIYAPYRLAAVLAGLFVAFFWTYFPYPLSARAAMRHQLGQEMYLLANYYSCVHTTIKMRLAQTGGLADDDDSPRRKLESIRLKLLGKQLGILGQLRQHSAVIPFEFSFGGKFPKATYDRLITTTQHLLNYMSLMAYSTQAYIRETADGPEHYRWLDDLNKLSAQIQTPSHDTTSLLIMLSSALIDGSPLPPYLSVPAAYRFVTKLNAIDPDLLSLRHITEPGYAAFAVTQVASALIHDDLKNLLEDVKALVGEVDFSFHIISTADSDTTTLMSTSSNIEGSLKGKKD